MLRPYMAGGHLLDLDAQVLQEERMAVREIIRDAMELARGARREWLTAGEITKEVLAAEPHTNRATIHGTVRYHCINDPSKKHSPSLQYRANPLFITDGPTVHGKRYRLLSREEREAFLSSPRDDLELVSYEQTMEWLANTNITLDIEVDGDDEPPPDGGADDVGGTALLEIHLQDYVFRHWKVVFPSLDLYKGADGREFRTSDPGVGIIDFLCTDAIGDFVVIETKRDMADRRAIGQILGYMGWVSEKLCAEGQAVKGILLAGEPSDGLRLAVTPVPNLELYRYEISFAVGPEAEFASS